MGMFSGGAAEEGCNRAGELFLSYLHKEIARAVLF